MIDFIVAYKNSKVLKQHASKCWDISDHRVIFGKMELNKITRPKVAMRVDRAALLEPNVRKAIYSISLRATTIDERALELNLQFENIYNLLKVYKPAQIIKRILPSRKLRNMIHHRRKIFKMLKDDLTAGEQYEACVNKINCLRMKERVSARRRYFRKVTDNYVLNKSRQFYKA